jgi:hypothetical protein
MSVDAGDCARSARLMIVFADRTTAVPERHGLFRSVDFAAARCDAHQSKEFRSVFRQFAAMDAAAREQWLRRGNSMIEPCCPGIWASHQYVRFRLEEALSRINIVISLLPLPYPEA